MDSYSEEERTKFAKIIGHTFAIKDIDFWENAEGAEPLYHVTYRLDINIADEGCKDGGRCDDIFFLDEDEIELVNPTDDPTVRK